MTAEKRDLFSEIMTGLEEAKAHIEGKITLKTYKVERPAPLPEVTPEMIRETRERLNLSRAVFAAKLRISPRTLERWEQGRARPTDAAAALILLVRKYPDTLEKLRNLAA